MTQTEVMLLGIRNRVDFLLCIFTPCHQTVGAMLTRPEYCDRTRTFVLIITPSLDAQGSSGVARDRFSLPLPLLRRALCPAQLFVSMHAQAAYSSESVVL